MSKKTGVYPCYENQFQIETAKATDTATLSNIANATTFSVAIDNTIQEWNAYEQEGWISRLMTGKSIKITISAKRTVGDAGNDMLASLAFVNGTGANKEFSWTFPDGSILKLNAVVSVTNLGAGEATDVAPLEAEIQSNGKPTYTPAA